MGLIKGVSLTLPPELRVVPLQISIKEEICRRPTRFSIRSYFGETFPVSSSSRWRNLEIHCENVNHGHNIQHPVVSRDDGSDQMPHLSFNRLQLSDEECNGLLSRKFGHFVAREAVLDEELWAAAWLRAEAYWESSPYMRHIDSHKRKYAEQEFYALKRRCLGQDRNSLKCFCFVAVKKEDKNIRRTVLNSVVGTLDLSIRQYQQGETYPGEIKKLSAVLANKEPFDAHKYAYIANVCVSKFARRQGIASNMIYLAREVASLLGMKQLFVHVNADNTIAQHLYNKTGFQIVDSAPSPTSKYQGLLMSMEL
ncbi:hypothetical protein SAY86_008725 [Trapa natans]|uniref:N-acetyltransferase domain-containing protein n=1 Tax=Trapa natans TaxID=22666 RepID=A0AAN7KAQ3_TRANT|nr:hypothetical protein SAY86_008725 [Trapa natans]